MNPWKFPNPTLMQDKYKDVISHFYFQISLLWWNSAWGWHCASYIVCSEEVHSSTFGKGMCQLLGNKSYCKKCLPLVEPVETIWGTRVNAEMLGSHWCPGTSLSVAEYFTTWLNFRFISYDAPSVQWSREDHIIITYSYQIIISQVQKSSPVVLKMCFLFYAFWHYQMIF